MEDLFHMNEKIPLQPFFPDINSQFNNFKSRAGFAFAASTWGIKCIKTARKGMKNFPSDWSVVWPKQPSMFFIILPYAPKWLRPPAELGNPVLSIKLWSLR